MQPKLSIMVPCFNEEETIPLFYEAVNKVTEGAGIAQETEFLFVNDGSKDQTLAVLRSLAAKDARVKYVSFSRNFGKEAAMYAGLKNSAGHYVVCIDADLQEPPELIAEMYRLMETGDYDCVEGRRTNRTNDPWLRTLLSRAFYKVMNMLSDVHIEDGARDFRMMNRKYVDSILALGERNRFSKGIFPWIGYRTHIVEFEYHDRAAGETKWSMFKLFQYSIDGIMGFSSKPLLLSALLGLASVLISLFWIVELIVRKLVFNNSIEGWSSMMCTILLLGGLQLFGIGVLGIYIAKIYTEIKKRPIYLVQEDNVNNNKNHD